MTTVDCICLFFLFCKFPKSVRQAINSHGTEAAVSLLYRLVRLSFYHKTELTRSLPLKRCISGGFVFLCLCDGLHFFVGIGLPFTLKLDYLLIAVDVALTAHFFLKLHLTVQPCFWSPFSD